MNILEKIKLQGQTLYDLRQDINKLEEAHKAMMDKMKEQRDKLQLVLIDSLTKNDMSSVKVRNGDSYSVQSRKSVVITELVFADRWAEKNHCVVLSKTLIGQALKNVPKDELPRGISFEEKQFISVRKSTKKVDN